MLHLQAASLEAEADAKRVSIPVAEEDLEEWDRAEVRRRAAGEGEDETVVSARRWLVVLDGWVVDVSGYIDEHVSTSSASLVESRFTVERIGLTGSA